MRYVLVSILALFIASSGVIVALVPARLPETKQAPAKGKKPAIPDMTMQSNWGQVTQEGRAITIAGHPSWFALGGIRDDGKVELVWTKAIDGHPCPGVYEWDGEKLVGQWGYAPDTYVENGELKGFTLSDTIRAVKPAMPDL